MSYPNRLFQFNPLLFSLLIIAAIVLLSSWINADTRVFWDRLDEVIFFKLNSLLDSGGNSLWNTFWAILNIRISDIFPFSIMLLMLSVPGLTFKTGQVLSGFVGFVLLLILLILIRELCFDELIEYFALDRVSPSLQLQPVVLLSELFPDWSPKDSATHSFPGDHASVLFLWLGYSLYFVRNRWSLLVFATSLFFVLPRLVGGAHWLSDIIVGGGFMALTTLAIGIATPLLNFPLVKICQVIRYIMQRLMHLKICCGIKLSSYNKN